MRLLARLLLIGVIYGGGSAQGTEAETEANLADGESHKMMYIGYPLLLDCNSTNLGSAFTLDWYKNGIKLDNTDRVKIFPDNSSLLIPHPRKDDVGDYKCMTSSGIPEDEPITKMIKVLYLEIRRLAKSLVLTEGEDLVVVCPVEGNPPPGIEWFKDRIPIKEALNESQVILQPNEHEMPDGKMTIKEIRSDQRGNYTCIITSPNAKYERSIYVRIKSVYAALWPFIGIVVEMLLLGVIIFIFEKRRAKAEYDESDTDQGNDQKNNRRRK